MKRVQSLTLDNISLTVQPGSTLAVVGESGAGKSTLIAAVLGLVKLTKGRITWNDSPVSHCRPALVMQEPRSAFNPVLSIRQTLMEPIVASTATLPHGRPEQRPEERPEERPEHLCEQLCDRLELPVDLLERRPGEISIGQAQRAGIIRALIAAPPLILFDEPLSALDAVTQKQTALLIADLQSEYGFAALIVTHDLGYALAFGDEIAVLRAGRIEELATPADFITSPCTAYGCELRDAAVALGALEPLR